MGMGALFLNPDSTYATDIGRALSEFLPNSRRSRPYERLPRELAV